MEMPKFGTKNALFGYFCGQNYKKSLTHTVNKGIGSAFFEGPGPGPGPLYKVCLPVVG